MSTITDAKLKSLIKVCKETGNTKKLAVVSFILTNNALNEIGMNLGIRSRDKGANETIFEYMRLINEILSNSLKISLFDEEIINMVKTIEIQFLKRKGDVPFEYVREMFTIYYDLKGLQIPNLYERFDDAEINYRSPEVTLYSYFSSGKKKENKKRDSAIKPLILHKVNEQEHLIREGLKKKFDKELFENALYLNKVKKSLEAQEKKGKIEVKGQLKDNIDYQRSLDDILGYSFLGLFILFLILGVVTLIESVLFPSLTGTLSLLFLATFGTSSFFFVIYWNYFRKDMS